MENPYDFKVSSPQHICRIEDAEECARLSPPAPEMKGRILTGNHSRHLTGQKQPVLMVGEGFLSRDDLHAILVRMGELEAMDERAD